MLLCEPRFGHPCYILTQNETKCLGQTIYMNTTHQKQKKIILHTEKLLQLTTFQFDDLKKQNFNVL